MIRKRRGRVLVVYQHLPHYRRAIFELMQDSGIYDYEFAASATPLDTSITCLDPETISCFHQLKNIQLRRFLWQSGLLRLILFRRFQAVIFLGDQSYVSTWLAAIVCRMFRVRVMMWTHGWSRHEIGARRLSRLTFYAIANHLLVYGNRARDLGVKLGYPAEKITVIYNSLSTRDEVISRQAGVDLAAAVKSDPPVLLCVGRLTARKKLDVLLDLAERLGRRGVPVRLWFIGEGPARRSLEQAASERGIEASFFGECYDANRLTSLTAQASLTVLPGDAGLSIIQSMECGIPVITNSNFDRHAPEVEAIVPGVNGDMFSDGSLDDLTDVVERWLGRSEVASKECAEFSLKLVVDRYSADGQLERIEGVLGHLLCPSSRTLAT